MMGARVILKSNIKKRVEHGHPWVYANEVEKVEGVYEAGDLVSILNFKGRFIGKGYINPKSQILVRIMTRE